MRTRLVVLGVMFLWGCGKNAIQPADSGAAGRASDAGAHDATGGAGTGGGAGGGGGAAGTSAINCATVGCAAPPLCSLGCTATCGCCACAEGDRQGDLVCHGGCYAPADGGTTPDAGDAGPAAFTSFRITSAHGPCPDGADCVGYIQIDGTGTLSRDYLERPDAGVGTAQLSAAELAQAAAIVTAPALVKLLDAAQPPCAPPTDIFEEMKLVDGAGTHENSTTACPSPPIKAARDELTALGNKYLPPPPR